MKNWFLQKNDSEQKIIVELAVFTLLILLYAFFYLPLKRDNDKLQSSINEIQTEIATMQSLKPKIAQFSNRNAAAVAMENSQIMALIEDVAKQQQLPLSKIAGMGENKISVTLNGVAFNAAMRWLDVLQSQYRLNISQLSVATEKKGLTNITVTISY